jgi:hypothetical protein
VEGAGSARTSSLPFGVNGTVSSQTKAEGTMKAGSFSASASRNFEVRGFSPRATR